MRNSARAVAAAFFMLAASCSMKPADAPDRVDLRAIETAAHGNYVVAINSNNVDTLMSDLTDDVVYQTPGMPELVGKAAVKPWAASYFGAYRTRWNKTSIGFTASGDWAF